MFISGVCSSISSAPLPKSRPSNSFNMELMRLVLAAPPCPAPFRSDIFIDSFMFFRPNSTAFRQARVPVLPRAVPQQLQLLRHDFELSRADHELLRDDRLQHFAPPVTVRAV